MRLPLLILHILSGTIGLLSGTFALMVRKGGRLHRASGNDFTLAMLTLASSAMCLAIMKSQRGNILGSFATFYLIGTAWLAGRRRAVGVVDWVALLVGGAAAILTLGTRSILHPATADPNAPAAMCFFMGAMLLLASGGIFACWFGLGFPGGRASFATSGGCALGYLLLRVFLPRPAAGFSSFYARFGFPDCACGSAISGDDLLVVSGAVEPGF